MVPMVIKIILIEEDVAEDAFERFERTLLGLAGV